MSTVSHNLSRSIVAAIGATLGPRLLPKRLCERGNRAASPQENRLAAIELKPDNDELTKVNSESGTVGQ